MNLVFHVGTFRQRREYGYGDMGFTCTLSGGWISIGGHVEYSFDTDAW